jgi:hypothetical protein
VDATVGAWPEDGRPVHAEAEAGRGEGQERSWSFVRNQGELPIAEIPLQRRSGHYPYIEMKSESQQADGYDVARAPTEEQLGAMSNNQSGQPSWSTSEPQTWWPTR